MRSSHLRSSHLRSSHLLLELTEILSKPESKINSLKLRIKEIKEKFNESKDIFSKLKIKQIKRQLYIKESKNLSAKKKKQKRLKKNLLVLEEHLSNLKKYHDYDDTEHKGIRDVRSFFDLPIDKDYYKPIIANDTFSSNYAIILNMKVKEIKTKLYQMKHIFI